VHLPVGLREGQQTRRRLAKIDKHIDWERFRLIIKAMSHNDTPWGGRPNTDEAVMVKLLVLQQRYDRSLER
jgi:IS5 family transposase